MRLHDALQVVHCTLCTLWLPERVLAHEVLGALPEAFAGERPVRVLHLLQGVWVERLGIGGCYENLKFRKAVIINLLQSRI